MKDSEGTFDPDRPGENGHPRRPTVLLADDHPLMLEGLRSLLAPDFAVAGSAAESSALVAAAAELRPDLVITEIASPEIDGVEVLCQLQASLPETRVLILSRHSETSWVQAAFAAGAWGYVTTSSLVEEIEVAVREVLQGHFYVSARVARAAILQVARHQEPVDRPFTDRELEVVGLLGKGMANKEIARRLGVSVSTIRTHLSSLYDKLGTTSRLELALYAAQHG